MIRKQTKRTKTNLLRTAALFAMLGTFAILPMHAASALAYMSPDDETPAVIDNSIDKSKYSRVIKDGGGDAYDKPRTTGETKNYPTVKSVTGASGDVSPVNRARLIQKIVKDNPGLDAENVSKLISNQTGLPNEASEKVAQRVKKQIELDKLKAQTKPKVYPYPVRPTPMPTPIPEVRLDDPRPPTDIQTSAGIATGNTWHSIPVPIEPLPPIEDNDVSNDRKVEYQNGGIYYYDTPSAEFVNESMPYYRFKELPYEYPLDPIAPSY